jgi:cytochrome c oxidase subunit 2
MRMISEILYKIFGFSLPERAMDNVYLVDDIYSFIMLISIFGFIGLMTVMIFFVLRYHKTQNDKSAYIPHNAFAETLWTVIPGILFVGIAIWGIWAFYEKEAAPENAMVVKVTGKQWMWEYTYSKDGQEFSTTNTLYLPINTPVVLDMTSVDVIHSFFIPSFRTKRDTVPGMRTTIFVEPNKLGDFAIYCAEFCGTSHSKMRGTVRVVSEKRFNKWINRQIKEANISDPVELGARLFNRKGCNSCHSLDGSRLIGPSFKGLWGRESEFEDGTKAQVDAEYIRESILMPNEKVVKGYPARMNSFAGQLSEKELDYLIEYIKTVK